MPIWHRALCELGIALQTTLGALVPREPLENRLSCRAAHSAGECIVGEQHVDAFPQLIHVAWLHEKPGHPVGHYLGHAANAATDHGSATRHCLEHTQTQELRDLYTTPVTRLVN